MLIHELKSKHPRKYRKPRVGRGGKRGTTSGHGTKGQKSRAGRKIRPAERDFIQRLPKLRGFKNKSFVDKPAVFNLGVLEKAAVSNIVNKKILIEAGFLRSGRSVKILSGGEIKKPLIIQGMEASKKAREKIEAAGGKIENQGPENQ